MASFIGFAPANNPRFATLVALDENNLSYGGEVAAPVFSEITQFALQQYGVAPTDLANTQFSAAQAHRPSRGQLVLGSARRRPGRGRGPAPGGAGQRRRRRTAARASGATGQGGTGAGAGTTADSLPPDPSKHP